MDPPPGLTEPDVPRPTRPLPSSAAPPSVEREQAGSTCPPDLGGTLVSHVSDSLGDLASDSDDDEGDASGSKRRRGKGKLSVPRRQIKIEYIHDKSRRNITFGKRKNGIFKKAKEISTLTGCEVMLIVAPKDPELQAYTYATARLQPLVTDPAGEAYIQNCLRYGALMPNSGSGTTAPYAMHGSSHTPSQTSTLLTGPRASPAPNLSAISYNSSYSYGSNNGMSRRAHPPYGLAHPLSLSPQSSPSTNGTLVQTPQSVSLSEQAKRETSGSPAQHIVGNRTQSSKPHHWSPGAAMGPGEFPTSPAVSAPSSTLTCATNREFSGEWPVPVNPRSLFQNSSPLAATSMSGRVVPSFPISTPASASSNGYVNPNHDGNSFSRPSSDGPITGQSPWTSMPHNPPGIRTTALNPGQNISSHAIPSNETGFLEPLVLSHPYDSRPLSLCEDQIVTESNTYASRIPSANAQPSLSPYGENEDFERAGRSMTYFQEDNGEVENRSYALENSDQNWPNGLH